MSSATDRSKRQQWFFLAWGLLSGAVVIASALEPQGIVGLACVMAAWVFTLIDRLSNRFSASLAAGRRRTQTVVWLVAVAVLLLGGGMLVWTVVGNGDGPLWLAWIVAVLVFAVIALGARVVGGRAFRQAQ